MAVKLTGLPATQGEATIKYHIVAPLTLAATIGLLGMALAQDRESAEPGWTGITNPEDVIAARQALMIELERLMRPIDIYTTEAPGHPAELRETAESIARMLPTLPHLFPPTTNVYDAADETPRTLALPTIWQDFATFYRLAAAASNAAAKVALANEMHDLREAALGLRASCDACHALHLTPYVPAGVSEQDLEFDFESVLSPD